MPTFEDGETGLSVRTKINAAITTVDQIVNQGGENTLVFASRDAFEQWVLDGNTAEDGAIASDGTVQYVASAGATAIADLNGWLPYGDVYGEHFGALPGRANKTVATSGIKAAAAYARSTGRRAFLGAGSFFVNDTVDVSGIVLEGQGLSPWEGLAAYYSGSIKLEAKTQIVLLGDEWQSTISLHGISSMKACGAARDGSAFKRAGIEENDWQLTSLMNADATTGAATVKDLKVGLLIEGEGSHLKNIRIVPDGGGDDGLDSYQDDTHAAFISDMDIGVLQIGGNSTRGDDVQIVGHYKVAGYFSAAIDRDGDYGDYLAPYDTTWNRCQFEGMRGVALRGPDKFAIIAETSTTVDLPWADDHPFTLDSGHTTIRLTSVGTGTDGGATFTYTGVAKVNVGGEDRIQLSGLVGFTSGSYDAIVPTSAGGANSHIVFNDCQIGGVVIPAGWLANDSDNVTGFISNGAIGGIEVSGWRAAEENFNNCRVQHPGSCALFKHDGREGIYDIMTECGPNRRYDRAMRFIVSPQHNRNTHATYPAGGARWMEWRYAMVQEYTADTIDFRPFMGFIPFPSLYSGDDGWFETYWAQRSVQVRHYSGTGGNENVYAAIPKLSIGPESEGFNGFEAEELLHIKAATGFVAALVEAVATGVDPSLALRTATANFKVRVDQSSGDDVLLEVDRGKTGTFTQILRDEGGATEPGLHSVRPFFADENAHAKKKLAVGETADLADDADLIVGKTSGDDIAVIMVDDSEWGGSQFSIPDDSVVEIAPPREGAYLLVTARGSAGFPQAERSSMFWFDVGSSNNLVRLDPASWVGTTGVFGANTAVSASALTGTSGTAGNLTLHAKADGNIQFENRSGAALPVNVTFL